MRCERLSGVAAAAAGAAAATPLDRLYLIGDLFRGSGYREALNLVSFQQEL